MIGVSYIIWKVFKSTFRNLFRPSVCTTIFKRIAGFHFYPKSFHVSNTSMNSSQRALQTNRKFFSNFEFNRKFLPKNKNIQKNSKAWILIKLQWVIYTKWICLNKVYKLMERFFQIWINFRIFGRKQNFFQKNSEAWILIKLRYFIYQWIRLNEVYKLRESFFSNFEFFLDFLAESEICSKE